MIGRALDSSNDFILHNGSFRKVEEGAETVQHVRSRIQFYLEEWFLNNTVGTPWFQEIFKKPANLSNVESILKARILQTSGVARLLTFRLEYEGASSRKLTVTFSAETIYGNLDEEKVFINA